MSKIAKESIFDEKVSSFRAKVDFQIIFESVDTKRWLLFQYFRLNYGTIRPRHPDPVTLNRTVDILLYFCIIFLL